MNRSYQVVVVRDAVAGTPAGYGAEVLDHSLSLVATLATTDEPSLPGRRRRRDRAEP